MSQKILILARTAPYGSSLAREAIDFALTSAAYDQNLSILFQGDGVFQLLKNQQPQKNTQKNHLSALEVLPLYDIEQLYAVKEDLTARGLTEESLGVPVNILTRAEAHSLISQQDSVMSF